MAYFAGATKIILITSENRELSSVDEFRFCKSKNVSNYEKKLDNQIHNDQKTFHATVIFVVFKNNYRKRSYKKEHFI